MRYKVVGNSAGTGQLGFERGRCWVDRCSTGIPVAFSERCVAGRGSPSFTSNINVTAPSAGHGPQKSRHSFLKMYISQPANASHRFVIVTDNRFKSDDDLDMGEPDRVPHVLDFYSTASKALGKHFDRATRIALFDYREQPTAKQRTKARHELRSFLIQNDVRVTCVIPTPNVDEVGEEQQANTTCWHAFGAPDALHEMRGCFYDFTGAGNYMLPLFPSSPFLKQLQIWQQAQWLRRGYLLAHGKTQLLKPPTKRIYPDAQMYAAIENMVGRPLAVDIESIEATGVITALGISDGRLAVSVPWEDYTPYNCGGVVERGVAGTLLDPLHIGRRVRDLLAYSGTAKIFHNYTFDVPRLQAKGVAINGHIHDTFAAHGIAYPELRHGLQHATASVLNITPWKSVWHPKLPGITRDDIEYWICDPIGLRDYNADDCYHTWHLAREVLPAVEHGGVFEWKRSSVTESSTSSLKRLSA